MLFNLFLNFPYFVFSGQESVRLFAGIADTSKDGLISFSEFQARGSTVHPRRPLQDRLPAV